MNEEREPSEQEDESDDLAVEGLSFFTGANAIELPINDPGWDLFERADRAVTDRVWRIYLRESGAPRADQDEDAMNSDSEPKGETMPTAPKKRRGEMLEQTLAAYRKVSAQIGAKPSAAEVYAELGPEKATSCQNVRMAMKRLEDKGLLEAPPTPVAPEKLKKRERVVLSAPAAAPTRRRAIPPTPSSTDPVLSALIAKRDALADKVAVLTSAIEAWQS